MGGAAEGSARRCWANTPASALSSSRARRRVTCTGPRARRPLPPSPSPGLDRVHGLGVPAVFLFGGLTRKERPLRLTLSHGDVVVWGGPSRLRYHGVSPLKEAHHPFAGTARINLTLRRAR